MRLRHILRVALATIGIMSPILTHVLLTHTQSALAAFTLILLQLAVVYWIVFAKLKSPYRGPGIAGLVICTFAMCRLHIVGGLVLSSGLPHAVTYISLLILFGATLLPNHEPIVSYFARMIHGPLTPPIQAYTRDVTMVWCIFFSLQLLGSALLLAFASIARWSLFVNVLNIPMVLSMFLGERLSRPLWVADPPRENFSDVMALVRLIKGQIVRRADTHF